MNHTTAAAISDAGMVPAPAGLPRTSMNTPIATPSAPATTAHTRRNVHRPGTGVGTGSAGRCPANHVSAT
ncbi:hypothetical protein [Actinophytocola sp. NPDC049390]|uniref:hypothetical protein n=1 Tax=Actinophytocola sp. NPDC049390 TaxID=3363894 RepID=UPI0037ACD8D1